MAFSENTHASLVAIAAHAPSAAHQAEAVRILAVDKLAELAVRQPPAIPSTCRSLFDWAIDGSGGKQAAGALWASRTVNHAGGPMGAVFLPPGSLTVAAWNALVARVGSDASALITAAGGTFEAVRDDVLELNALHAAGAQADFHTLYQELFV